MRCGVEWVIDAEGCRPKLLTQPSIIEKVCQSIIAELGLQVVGRPQWHQFPEPAGVTCMYLLSESHLTCHTFPESGVATFNLFSCLPKPDWDWEAQLSSALGATHVGIRKLTRSGSMEFQSAASSRVGERP